MSDPNAVIAYYVSEVIDSAAVKRSDRGGPATACKHRHRSGPTAAECGARRIRRRTACVNTNPENLPAVLGYSVVPRWV